MNKFTFIGLLLATLALTACGGGASTGDAPIEKTKWGSLVWDQDNWQ